MGFFTSFRDTLNFKQFKDHNRKLYYYCPWSFFCGAPQEGIVVLKTGSLMRCYTYICPDLGSSSVESINSVAWTFNEAIKQLGSEWSAHFETQRALSSEYPGTNWTNIAGYLIDKRREEKFVNRDAHFINRYYLTLTKLLPSEIYSRTKQLLYKTNKDEGQGFYNLEFIKKQIQDFRSETESIIARLTTKINIRNLNDDETCTYMHSTVSTNFHPVKAMMRPVFIDSFITDCDLENTSTMKLGDYYIPTICITGFPVETFPAMLHSLNASEIEYRWSIRWIGRNKKDSSKDIERYQKRFYGSRKTWGTAIMEVVGGFDSMREDPAAAAFEEDTNEAKVELAMDQYSFGYFSATMLVWDTDYTTATEKARYVTNILSSAGFEAKIISAGSFQAFLGMMPGNTFSNVRRPVLSSGNLSHIIPLSSVWAGDRQNRFTKETFGVEAPLLICSTSSKIAFFLNLNVGDVGHTFIFGPTGAGKSTLLCLIESQFLKYHDANVIIFDKDKSARGITIAAGGIYEEPGMGNIAFQPLRDLEQDTDMYWASEFIQLLLSMQGIETNATMNEAIAKNLKLIKETSEPDQRTLSTFQQYVEYVNPETGINDIKIGLQPYTLGGQYGNIFDASNTKLGLSKWTMIEMGTLMKLGEKAVTPALMFLFHFVEKIWSRKDGTPTGKPTILVLDEAWVFLNNEYFMRTIEDWLTTLRKKNVFCVFATQEVSKAATSKISTTIASLCMTKIYLADPSAENDMVAKYYLEFGLENNEITAISRATMKKDYFYKSPLGARMFELNLDQFQLALLSPDHALLDELEQKYGRNCQKPLATQILEAKGFTDHYRYLEKKKDIKRPAKTKEASNA